MSHLYRCADCGYSSAWDTRPPVCPACGEDDIAYFDEVLSLYKTNRRLMPAGYGREAMLKLADEAIFRMEAALNGTSHLGARTACVHCYCGDNFERRQT